MSAFLTWAAARDLALSGTPVRRDGWATDVDPIWLERRTGLWVLTDANHALVRVADAEWFTSEEFFAEDWTTDAPGTARDVCEIEPPKPIFFPPGLGVSGSFSLTGVTLFADLGASSPSGVYLIRFFLDGVFVGSQEADGPGRYSVSVTTDPTAVRRAWIDVESRLPLPKWSGHAEWDLAYGDGSYIAIPLAPDFPSGGYLDPAGWPYGAGVTYGPFSGNRWIYSHASNPAGADDDLAIDGVILYGDSSANYVNGGATTFLHYLPAGQTMVVNVWNAGGQYWAIGELRAYNRPL